MSPPTTQNDTKIAIEDVLDNDDYDDGSYGPVLVRLASQQLRGLNLSKRALE
jgi:hypothetical protein